MFVAIGIADRDRCAQPQQIPIGQTVLILTKASLVAGSIPSKSPFDELTNL